MNNKKHAFGTLKEQIHELPQQYYIEGCDSEASFNNLLQKKVILNQIEDVKHVYLLIFNNHYDPPIYPHRKGVEKNSGYKGFCFRHDNDLFKPNYTP